LRRHSSALNSGRSIIMGKQQQSNKEQKKQPAMSPKEKKVAKQAKKNAPATPPMVPRG
jgi:hypothetical protein